MTRRAAVHNLGCKVNAYEAEAVRQLLEDAGYTIVPFTEDADVYVVNTCTVTNIADRKSRQMLRRARKRDPEAAVVAVGCYAQVRGEELERDPDVDLVVGSSRKTELPALLERFFADRRAVSIRADLTRDRVYERMEIARTESHTRAFVKIQDGCDRFCSYCIIPYARGRVRSRGSADVLREAERLAASGVREIVLTGIHLCSYGKDREEADALPSLIEAVHETPGLERLRLGSLEPSYVTEPFVRRLAALPKLCPHFHLSLQSGCDATLGRMNRHYTTAEFAEKAALFRKWFRSPALTTDIITGFPGETDAEFAETVRFVESMRFFETHIFPYSRREGTKAAAMDGQLTERVKKERSRVLLELGRRRQAEFLETFLHRPLEVLFEECVSWKGGTYWSGHGREYQKVLAVSGEDLTGRIGTVVPEKAEEGMLICINAHHRV